MPRPAPTDPRERVIEAALRRLDTAGPSAVTLREVAADIGRSTQVIYSYFGDRDTLMHELRVRISIDIAHRSQAYVDRLEAPELDAMLEAAGLAIIDYALEHPHLFMHANTGIALAGISKPAASAAVAEAWAFLFDPMRAARSENTQVDLETEMRLRYAMTYGIATLAISGHYGPEPRAVAHGLLREAMHLRFATADQAAA